MRRCYTLFSTTCPHKNEKQGKWCTADEEFRKNCLIEELKLIRIIYPKTYQDIKIQEKWPKELKKTVEEIDAE